MARTAERGPTLGRRPHGVRPGGTLGRPPRGVRHGAPAVARPDSVWQRIYRVVRGIPRGRIATYGQVAVLAGLPNHARHVGFALHALPEGTPLPWHRVLNARGGISLRGDAHLTQRLRLVAEGVRFDPRGRVRLEEFRWARGGRAARGGTGGALDPRRRLG